MTVGRVKSWDTNVKYTSKHDPKAQIRRDGIRIRKRTNTSLKAATKKLQSADHLCKQLGPRSGPTERRSRSGSKSFDTERYAFEKHKLIFKKGSAVTIKLPKQYLHVYITKRYVEQNIP